MVTAEQCGSGSTDIRTCYEYNDTEENLMKVPLLLSLYLLSSVVGALDINYYGTSQCKIANFQNKIP